MTEKKIEFKVFDNDFVELNPAIPLNEVFGIIRDLCLEVEGFLELDGRASLLKFHHYEDAMEFAWWQRNYGSDDYEPLRGWDFDLWEDSDD